MKIMFCTSSMGKGGSERVISILSNKLSKNNEVSILINTTKNIAYKLNEKIKIVELDDKYESNNFIRNITRIKKTRKIIKKETPDIIICFLPMPSFRILIANRKNKIPVIVADRANPQYEYRSRISKILMKILYKKADAFVFQTNEQKEYYDKKIQNKSTIIFNPISDEFIEQKTNRLKEEKIIISIGRLANEKNQKMLINAFSDFSKNNQDYKLKIFGEGPLREELQEQIDILDMKEKIILCGVSDNIKQELEKSEIFVLSSNNEGMPNALIEAMSLGLPVISTDCPCGGARELIVNGVNGILIPVNNKEELTKNIKKLVKDKEFASKLGKNAKKIKTALSTDKIVNQWENYIDAVIANKKNDEKKHKKIRKYFKENINLYIKMTSIIPDNIYLKILYKLNFGKTLNLKRPQSFNEKMQWLKLYNRKPEYTKMVDKYEVKRYIAEKLGEEIIIPTIGIYEKFEDIDFDDLPDKFVIKCTHDSGSTIICKNKQNFDLVKAKKKIEELMKKKYFYQGREWPYKNVKPRIILEKYMVDESKEQLKDYKVFNFNGQPKLIQVDFDRFNGHKRNMYTTEWKKLDMNLVYKINNDINIERPQNLEKILQFAKLLSSNEPFLRTDFYVINDKIYFGEITFFPESGFGKFNPEKYDRILGDMIELPKEKIK